MKRIIFFLVFSIVTTIVNAQQTPEAQMAHKIANKMADSLSLTNQQRAKVFTINMELSKKKTESRKKSSNRAIVGQEMQQIEGTRDAMYKTVLTQEQYILYMQKKRNLVNNN